MVPWPAIISSSSKGGTRIFPMFTLYLQCHLLTVFGRIRTKDNFGPICAVASILTGDEFRGITTLPVHPVIELQKRHPGMISGRMRHNTLHPVCGGEGSYFVVSAAYFKSADFLKVSAFRETTFPEWELNVCDEISGVLWTIFWRMRWADSIFLYCDHRRALNKGRKNRSERQDKKCLTLSEKKGIL